jgi:hypothetical protein
LSSKPAEAIQELRAFVKDASLDRSVSRGEIYGLIVEYYSSQSDLQAAAEVLKEMKINVPVQPGRFIKPETLKV